MTENNSEELYFPTRGDFNNVFRIIELRKQDRLKDISRNDVLDFIDNKKIVFEDNIIIIFDKIKRTKKYTRDCIVYRGDILIKHLIAHNNQIKKIDNFISKFITKMNAPAYWVIVSELNEQAIAFYEKNKFIRGVEIRDPEKQLSKFLYVYENFSDEEEDRRPSLQSEEVSPWEEDPRKVEEWKVILKKWFDKKTEGIKKFIEKIKKKKKKHESNVLDKEDNAKLIAEMERLIKLTKLSKKEESEDLSKLEVGNNNINLYNQSDTERSEELYHNETGRQAIWHGKVTKGYTAWLEKCRMSVDKK